MKAGKNQYIKNCKIGRGTVVRPFVNLYGCVIGSDCMIGTFVEIQKGVHIGNKVRVQSHSFICDGVTIEDDVFVGHHVVFINDNNPHATNKKGDPITPADWKLSAVRVMRGASIGSNATILGGVTIGKNAMVGAGAVVTKNVADNAVVVGNPAARLRKVKKRG